MNERVGVQVGRRLREIREAAGLTQAQLAELSRKSIETISNFERGKTVPSLLTLDAISKCLHTPLRDFFSAEAIEGAPIDNAVSAKLGLLDPVDQELLLGILDLMSRKGRKR